MTELEYALSLGNQDQQNKPKPQQSELDFALSLGNQKPKLQSELEYALSLGKPETNQQADHLSKPTLWQPLRDREEGGETKGGRLVSSASGAALQGLSGSTLGIAGAMRDRQQVGIDKTGETLFGEKYIKPAETDPILEANRAVQGYVQKYILPENMDFSEKIAAGVGSMAGAIAPGIITGNLLGGSLPSGAAVAKAIPGGAKLMQAFPKIGAALEAASGERVMSALVGGLTEGMTQASAVYEKALQETGDKEIAGNAMTKTLLANIPLNAMTNVVGYGVGHELVEGVVKKAIMKMPLAAKLSSAAIDKASKVIAQSLSGASSEFPQETGQGLLEQRYGERKPWKEVLSPANIYEVAKDEGVLGGIVGGLTGGAFAGFSGSPSVSENVVSSPSLVAGTRHQAAVNPELVGDGNMTIDKTGGTDVSQLSMENFRPMLKEIPLGLAFDYKSKSPAEMESIAKTAFNSMKDKVFIGKTGEEIVFDTYSKGGAEGVYLEHFLKGGTGKDLHAVPIRAQAVLLIPETIEHPTAVIEQKDGRRLYMGLYRGLDNSLHEIVVKAVKGADNRYRIATSFVARGTKNDPGKVEKVLRSKLDKASKVIFLDNGQKNDGPQYRDPSSVDFYASMSDTALDVPRQGRLSGHPRLPSDQYASLGNATLNVPGDNIIPNPDQDVNYLSGHSRLGFEPETQSMQQSKPQQQIVAEYQAAVDPGLVKFIKAVELGKTTQNSSYKVSTVSPKLASDVKALTGVDVGGGASHLKHDNVKHMINRHGASGKADRSLGDINDIARIGYVLNNYDSIELSDKKNANFPNNKGEFAPVVILRKAVNGTYVVAEAVPLGDKKQLYLLSARIVNNRKAGNLELTDAGKSLPTRDVRNDLQDSPASDTIIPNPDQDVNYLSGHSRLGFEPQMPQGTGDVQGKVRDVKKIISNVLGIPVREGNVRKKDVLGYIDHTQQVIRSKHQNDISVLLHEFGHAIDKRFGLSGQSEAAQHELASFGASMGYEPGKHVSEGLAQFFQWYGIDPEQARAQFPQYTKLFENFINSSAEGKALIDPIFKATREYYNGSPEARLRAVVTDGTPDPKSLAERVKDIASRAYEQIVDRQATLKGVNQKVADQLGMDVRMLPDEFNLEAAARTHPGFQRKASQYIERMIGYLNRITKPEYRQLVDYFTAGGALGYYANGMEPGVGLSVAELQQIRANTPQEVRLLADEIRDTLQQVVDNTLVRSGIVSKKMIADWRKKYPDYVPMIADTTDGDVQLLSPKAAMNRGFVDQPHPVRKRKGAKSDRDIVMRVNPLVSMIENVARYHAAAAKNDVGRVAMNISQLPGLASIAEKVPGPGKNTFYVWENGVRKYFATDPEIYQALTALGEYSVPNHMISNLAHRMSEIFKAGTTRYNPWFIAKNFFRDTFTVAVQSRSDITDIKAIPIISTIDGILEMTGGDKRLLQEAIDDGVFYSSMIELRKNPTVKLLMKSLQDGDKFSGLKGAPKRVGSWNETVEMAPKFREYKVLREQGIPRKQAAMEAREVNTDFHRAGSFGRVANQYVPFLNAQIQGVDKTFRTFKNNPVKSAMKAGLFLALPSAIEWALYHDDEEWQRMDQGIKDTHWLFRLPGGESDEFIRVPMPFEIGVLFGGTTKRALNSMFQKDPAAWYQFSKSIKDAMQPEFLPNAVRTGIELWSNKDMFRDRPIVPMKEERLPAHMQYGNSTSWAAKRLGKAMNVSPRKIDHAIRGIGGTMTAQAVNMLDFLEPGKTAAPTRRLSDNAFIHPYTANSTSLAGSVNRFYDIAEQLEREYNGARKEGGYPPAMAKEFMARRQGMGKVWKAIAAIREHSGIPPGEKRKRIDALNKEAIKIAENGLKRYDAMRERR